MNHFLLFIVSPKHHQALEHGWTIFVVEELRTDSLIVLLALSELDIAPTHKTWPWSVLVCFNYLLTGSKFGFRVQ